jgi:DNA primase
MGGIISSATLEQVRAASDIVDVIGSYVPLKRAGANFIALCPFHKEKTPSFNVHPARQIFHCFGCHKGGDVFTFVKEYENIDFPDAVRRLAERARIPIESEQGTVGAESRHLKDRLFQIHEQITQKWQHALASDERGAIARDYLAHRGVSPEAVQLFRLGYALDAWDDTVNWAKSKHHDLPFLEQAGLVIRKEGGDHFYDRFRGRLIFPICDEQGRVVAFSGRVLAGDEKTAKYVNSPETPIFTKGKIIFGLDKSKRALLDTHCAIICEGQLDLIACFMGGVKNVVAPQGTAFTSEHARLLKRYVDEVVLCFDSDNAGQNATTRSLDILLAAGLAIRVATVPAPHDPDSFIKESGADAFAQLIEKAPGFFDYYLDRLCATNDPSADRGRAAIVRAMSEAVNKSGSDLLRDTYAQKTALRLAVAADAIRSEFKKRSSSSMVEQEDTAQSAPTLSVSAHERCLLRFLFDSDQHDEWIASHLELEWVENPVVREMIACRLQSASDWHGLAAWLSQHGNPQWVSSITDIMADEKELLLEANLKGCVKTLRDNSIKRELAAITRSLSVTDLPEPERDRLLSRKAALNRLKRTPLTARSDQH